MNQKFTTTNMDNFLTPQEVADKLKICTKTVLKLIKNGKIKSVIVGGTQRVSHRIYEKEIDRFISENYERKGE